MPRLVRRLFARCSAVLSPWAVVPAALAALVVGMWVRSAFVDDRIRFNFLGHDFELRSHRGGVSVSNAHVWQEYWTQVATRHQRMLGSEANVRHLFRQATTRGTLVLPPQYEHLREIAKTDIEVAANEAVRMTVPPRVFEPRLGPRTYAPPYYALLLMLPLLPVVLLYPPWRLAVALARWRSGTVRRGRGFCQKCGYDVRATPARCPECGAEPGVLPPPCEGVG